MKLDEITRTEVFFTAHLYIACKTHKNLVEKLLIEKLKIDENTKIIDFGFEVCLFRDFAKAGIFKRIGDNSTNKKSFEKQTFDNVFILSNNSINSIVLLEAKVHGRFRPDQIKNMKIASEIIKEKESSRFNKVYLVGLHSSKYSPKEITTKDFDTLIKWKELEEYLPSYRSLFSRADEIYNDRKTS